MELQEINQKPHLIAAMTLEELHEFVNGLASQLEQMAGILRIAAKRITTEPVQPSRPRQLAATHYEPMKKIVKRLKERGGDKKLNEEWVRNLALREGIPHRIDTLGNMVMRWRDFTVWEKRWLRDMDPDVKRICEELMKKMACKEK